MSVSAEHPYTPAFDAGDAVYVSGALSVDPAGVAAVGPADSLRAALLTLRRRLATVDLDLEHVAKLTYFVTDVTMRDEANVQFAAAFAAPRPARTFVEVSALPYGCTVEIEATAVHRPMRPASGLAG